MAPPEGEHSLDESPSVRRRVGGSLFVCFAASVIEFASAADFCDAADSCDDAENGWAIAVGVISAFICILRLALIFQHHHLEAKFDLGIALVLVVLWAFGAAFSTGPDGPFPVTNNGYFATWIAFLSAIVYASMAVAETFDALRSTVAVVNAAVLIVFFTSLVEMAVAADVCDNANDCTERNGFAVAVGAVASAVCIAYMLLIRLTPDVARPVGKAVSLFLVCWWAAGAGVNTSAEGPFNSSCGGGRGTANGYFATWVAFFASIYMFYQNFHPVPPGFDDESGSGSSSSRKQQQQQPQEQQQQQQQQPQDQSQQQASQQEQPQQEQSDRTVTETQPMQSEGDGDADNVNKGETLSVENAS